MNDKIKLAYDATNSAQFTKDLNELEVFVEFLQTIGKYDSRELSLLSATSLIAVAAGTRFLTRAIPGYVTAAQRYSVGIGKSGSGKDAVMQAMNETQLHETSEYAAMITSYTAMHEALQHAPNHNLFCISDELGGWLQEPGQHFPQLLRLMLQAFSAQGSKTKLHPVKNRDKKDKLETITGPSFNLLGLSQPEVLAAAVTENLLDNGFLGRLFYVEVAEPRLKTWEEREKTVNEETRKLIFAALDAIAAGPINIERDKWDALSDAEKVKYANQDATIPLNPVSKEILQRIELDEERLKHQGKIGKLHARLTEHTVKFAMLLSIWRAGVTAAAQERRIYKDDLVMTTFDVELAERMVRQSIAVSVALFTPVFEDEGIFADVKQTMNTHINSNGGSSNFIPYGTLVNKLVRRDRHGRYTRDADQVDRMLAWCIKEKWIVKHDKNPENPRGNSTSGYIGFGPRYQNST